MLADVDRLRQDAELDRARDLLRSVADPCACAVEAHDAADNAAAMVKVLPSLFLPRRLPRLALPRS